MPPSHDGGDLTHVDSFQYPSGHVSHLKQPQTAALDQFKELCKSKGYWTPPTQSEPPSHDDETLLRYLRARKFVPKDAFAQFKETEDWRAENKLDDLYETIDVEDYERTRRLYPQWLGRRDKRGLPLYLFEVSHLDHKAVAAYQSHVDSKSDAPKSSKVPIKMLRLFALYENLCRFVMPLCSAVSTREHPETPVSQSNNIVDISGVGIRQFWNLKNHMQDASLLATAHYPETLDRIFLIGAPSFFPTVWSWIKRWFDPITVSKIFVLSSSQTLPTLLKYIDIENIPKKYGGKLDFEFGDLPSLDETLLSEFKWEPPIKQGERRTIPTGPIKWEHGDNGRLLAVAVGSENGVRRHKVLAGLQPDASVGHIALTAGRTKNAPNISTTPAAAAASTTAPANGAAQPPAPTAGQALADEKKPGQAHVPATSREGTYTVPYRDDMPSNASSPPQNAREGTSATRYEQQAQTHAHGQLAEGTPAVRVDGQGEKQMVMDPKTVGQAPKEHPGPEPEQPQQPSIMEQAQHTAEHAYEQAAQTSQSILSAVGLGGKKEEPLSSAAGEEKKEDPEVDNMDGGKVEEFLRSKTMSKPQA